MWFKGSEMLGLMKAGTHTHSYWEKETRYVWSSSSVVFDCVRWWCKTASLCQSSQIKTFSYYHLLLVGLFLQLESVSQGPRGLCSGSLTNSFSILFCCYLIRQKAALLKLSVPSVVSAQRKANNDWLMSWLCSCFVSSWKQINSAARTLASVQFVSEVTGLKMSAEIKKAGMQNEGKKKEWKREENIQQQAGKQLFLESTLERFLFVSLGQNNFSNY